MRVFISYTAEDLADHAGVVADFVRRLEWVAVDHRDWGASGRPSVSECKRRVESCNILVVLAAHRYGWIPSEKEGGDGKSSITWLEVQWARASGLEVLPYLIDPEASWPVKLIEALGHGNILEHLEAFKADLRQYISGFLVSILHRWKRVWLSICCAPEKRLTLQGQQPRNRRRIRVRHWFHCRSMIRRIRPR
jgi:Domain of unknown function (DUF4062)